MQKFMSLVLSATMFAYMACGETVQKSTNNKNSDKQISTDTVVNHTEKTTKALPVSEEK